RRLVVCAMDDHDGSLEPAHLVLKAAVDEVLEAAGHRGEDALVARPLVQRQADLPAVGEVGRPNELQEPLGGGGGQLVTLRLGQAGQSPPPCGFATYGA